MSKDGVFCVDSTFMTAILACDIYLNHLLYVYFFPTCDIAGFPASKTVRRDNCALVRVVLNTVLQKILIEKSVSGAIAYG